MKKKIGEILVAHKAISAQDIGEALAFQTDGDPGRLGEILVQRGRLEADALARALAEQKALPYTELNLVSSSFAQVVPLSFQNRHRLIPFEELSPGEFCIAVADPLATDAIERARSWLNAKSIHLYVASADEIGRVLSALEDQGLASGEILASTGEAPAVDASEETLVVLTTESAQPPSALSEEDLFGSLKFEEDEQAAQESTPAPSSSAAEPVRVAMQLPSAAPLDSDELTQIVRRPGPPADMDTVLMKTSTEPSLESSTEREITPVSGLKLPAGDALSDEASLRAQLAELLAEKGTEELASIMLGLAELLVRKSLVSREEVLDIFASQPTETW